MGEKVSKTPPGIPLYNLARLPDIFASKSKLMHSLFKLLIMGTWATMTATSTPAQQTSKKALLVIDVQENLLDPHSKLHMEPASMTAFLGNLNKSITFCKEHNIPVIYTQNIWTNPILNLITGNVCKKGARGTGIDARVCRVTDTVYTKSKMSAFKNKDLSTFLQENSITELYIAGLFAEACVKGTAKDAISKGYKVTIIEEAVGSRSSKKKIKAILLCRRKGARVIKSEELKP